MQHSSHGHFQEVVISFLCFHRIWRFFGGLEEAVGSWSAVDFFQKGVQTRSARMGLIRLQKGPGWEREWVWTTFLTSVAPVHPPAGTGSEYQNNFTLRSLLHFCSTYSTLYLHILYCENTSSALLLIIHNKDVALVHMHIVQVCKFSQICIGHNVYPALTCISCPEWVQLWTHQLGSEVFNME